MPRYSKDYLIEHISNETGVSKVDVREVLNQLKTTISEMLEEGTQYDLGFEIVERVRAKAASGTVNGKSWSKPNRLVTRFRFSKTLRDKTEEVL